MPQVNNAGLELIKESESCSLVAYRDIVGVLTIGWGHTGPDVHDGQTITQADADKLLENDVHKFELAVNDMVTHSITPNQFAALVSFAYNVGADALKNSTLLRLLNAGDVAGAAEQFGQWVYAGGRQPGLVTRRERERALFLTP